MPHSTVDSLCIETIINGVLNENRKHRNYYKNKKSYSLLHSRFIRKESFRSPSKLPHLSRHAQSKVDWAIQNAWAKSTLGKYGNGVDHFLGFCKLEKVSEKFRLPASEFLLCAFAAHRAGTIAGGTIRNEISAVHAWHTLNNATYHGGSRLAYVLKGCEDLTPDSSRKPPRPPITRSMLEILHKHLDKDNPFDACCAFTASVAVWGQIRLGELLSDTLTKWDPTHIPSGRHMGPPSSNAGSRLLHLVDTKVAGKKGEDVYICRQRGPSDAIKAYENHMRVNKTPPDEPLCSYESAPGKYLPLTRKRFLAHCNEVWMCYGFPISTGHSFRIGGTTKLLLANVAPDVVKLMGRWSSDAFLRYWRSLELIAPMHAEFLKPSMREATKKCLHPVPAYRG